MNFSELDKAAWDVAASATVRFGDKANTMTFLKKENGCAAFMEVNGWFLWYWLDYSNWIWKDTHMLYGENWLNHE